MLGSQVYIWLIVPPSHNNAFIILVGLQLTYVQNRDISTVAKLRVKSLSKRAKFVIKRTCKLIFWLIPQTRILLTAATCEILEEMKVCPVGIWRLSRLNGNLIRFKLNQRRKGGTFATSQAWYITRPWYVLNWIRGSFSRSTRQTELVLNNGKILEDGKCKDSVFVNLYLCICVFLRRRCKRLCVDTELFHKPLGQLCS